MIDIFNIKVLQIKVKVNSPFLTTTREIWSNYAKIEFLKIKSV